MVETFKKINLISIHLTVVYKVFKSAFKILIYQSYIICVQTHLRFYLVEDENHHMFS